MCYKLLLCVLVIWPISVHATTIATIVGTPVLVNTYEVNVLTYGADGGDLVDDTTAIQAAINAVPVGGGIVRFPTGTYLLSNQLVINRSNITLVGDKSGGSMLKIGTYWNTFDSGYVAAMVNLKGVDANTHIHDVTIEGLHFYGDPHVSPNDANEPKCISGKWADSVVIRGNYFEHFGHECIWPAGTSAGDTPGSSREWKVVENRFYDIGVGGSSPSAVTINGKDFLVANNHFDTVLAAVGASDQRAVIVGNVIKNVSQAGIASAGDSPGSDDVVIVGNQIEVTAGSTVRYGIRVIDGARGTVVSGNTVRIKTVDGATSITGIYLQGPSGVNVSGNSVYVDTTGALTGGAATVGLSGIDNGHGLDVYISGNVFTLANENTGYCAMMQFKVTNTSHVIKVFLNGNQTRGLSRANASYAIDFNETANGKTNYWIANHLTNSGFIRLVGTFISDDTYDGVLINLSVLEP